MAMHPIDIVNAFVGSENIRGSHLVEVNIYNPDGTIFDFSNSQTPMIISIPCNTQQVKIFNNKKLSKNFRMTLL